MEDFIIKILLCKILMRDKVSVKNFRRRISGIVPEMKLIAGIFSRNFRERFNYGK